MKEMVRVRSSRNQPKAADTTYQDQRKSSRGRNRIKLHFRQFGNLRGLRTAEIARIMYIFSASQQISLLSALSNIRHRISSLIM